MLTGGSARHWTSFGAVLLTTVGTLNVAEGLLATLANDAGFNRTEVLAFTSTSTWGAATATLGLVLACTGLVVRPGRHAARRAAIGVVALHALSQVALLRAYPAWSLLMMSLDVLMLFVLTVPRSWAAPERPQPAQRPEPAKRPEPAQRPEPSVPSPRPVEDREPTRADTYRPRHKARQPVTIGEWSVGPIAPPVRAVGQATVPATVQLPLVSLAPVLTAPPPSTDLVPVEAIVSETTPSDLDVEDEAAQPVGAVVRPYV
jgi:hypothetical protein